MIVNDKYRFVFVHIPKTAGTSVRSVLGKLEGRNRAPTQDINTRHETPVEMFARHGIDTTSVMPGSTLPISDYLFFCFVRNPWARFCSLHRYLLARTKEMGNRKLPDDVNDFARRLGDEDPWILHFHSIRRQTDFISPDMGFIGRYENLDADFATIMSRLGLNVELPHKNASSYAKEDYRTLLTPASAEIIARHYAADVATLGYEF